MNLTDPTLTCCKCQSKGVSFNFRYGLQEEEKPLNKIRLTKIITQKKKKQKHLQMI